MKWKIIILLTPLLMMSCSSHQSKVMVNGEVQPSLSSVIKEKMTRESIEQHVAQWPKASQEATKFMMDKYGLPSGFTDEMLVWSQVSPFKRCVVHKQDKKVLEEVISYNIGPREAQRLLEFQKDIKVDYSKQELSVYSDHEEENILTLNVANEVMKGKLSPRNARVKMKKEKSSELSKSLLFVSL